MEDKRLSGTKSLQGLDKPKKEIGQVSLVLQNLFNSISSSTFYPLDSLWFGSFGYRF